MLREMLRICLRTRDLLKLSFYSSKAMWKWKVVVPVVARLSKVSFFKVIFDSSRTALWSIVRVASYCCRS